jgi:hypothetical protein
MLMHQCICEMVSQNLGMLLVPQFQCERDIIGNENFSLLVIPIISTTFTGTPVLHLEAISFVTPWLTTISVVSALSRRELF